MKKVVVLAGLEMAARAHDQPRLVLRLRRTFSPPAVFTLMVRLERVPIRCRYARSGTITKLSCSCPSTEPMRSDTSRSRGTPDCSPRTICPMGLVPPKNSSTRVWPIMHTLLICWSSDSLK